MVQIQNQVIHPVSSISNNEKTYFMSMKKVFSLHRLTKKLRQIRYNVSSQKHCEVKKHGMAGIFYIDIWFGINFGMNLLLLWIVGEISRKPFRVLRMILSAAAGAFGACLLLYFFEFFPIERVSERVWNIGKTGSEFSELKNLTQRLWKLAEGTTAYLLLPFLMIKCAFPISDRKEGIRMLLLFYLAACLTGGIGEIVLRQTGRHVWSLIFLAAGMLCVIKAAVLPLMKGESEKQRLYDIELVKREEHIKIRALLDTGNRLYDPYRGRPVCVVSVSCVEKVMENEEGVLYIPYQSIGTEKGMLPAMIFDEMMVFLEKETIRIKNPIIAVYKGTVSADGSYELLLHKDLLAGKKAK